MKTKQETILFIENNKNKGKISNILKSVKNEIDFYISSNISTNNKLTLKAYSLIMNLSEIPKCEICHSNKIKFISFENGFEKCCSKKCYTLKNKNEEILELNELKTIIKQFYLKIEPSEYNKYIEKNNILSSILHYTKFLPINNIKNTQRLYTIMNEIQSIPLCKNCGEETKYINFKVGYRDFCSVKCSSNSFIKQTKTKETNLQKYGFENVSQVEQIKEIRTNTNIKKYGVENVFQNKDIQDKSKKTNIKNFGKPYPSQNIEIIKKMKTTNLERYGFDNPQKNNKIKEKKIDTNINKYGVNYSSQKHIFDIQNLNGNFINNNFKNENGLLNRNNILKYFNISVNMLQNSKTKIQNLLPFDNKYQKTQNEIYNLFYNNNLSNEDNQSSFNVKKSDYQFSFNVKINDRQFIKYQNNEGKEGKLEIDILDYDNKFGIEYNGLMFHSFGISNHSMFNNDDKESLDKNNHKLKTDLCEEKHFQLFHIFENEWLNEQKRNIWISMINGKLNKHNKIFARKTIIKEIKLKDKYGNITNKNDNNLVKEFLNKNHLQGYVASSINIGLFIINKSINNDINLIEEQEELVSIMTFGKPRMSKSYEYELLRYASKLNMTIIGGGSKLLAYFEKHYKPKSLISYANRRWSLGNFYFKTGFQFSHISEPNYFYFLPEDLSKLTYKSNNECETNNSILYSRNQFQKHKLEKYYFEGKLSSFDNNLTETQNMYNNNYRKIYDSGNLIFFKIY